MSDNPASPAWHDVERVYQGACDCAAQDRDAFLTLACGADADLRREVESLLQFESASEVFLERPALGEAADALASSPERFEAGRRVGGYQILSLQGVGGMGEVYRARDLRLERDVALKVVERSFASDATYIGRIEEEARAASALSHPNIVTIYGVGEDAEVTYIAMELVQGRTLREMLSREPLSVPHAIDIAVQLSDAMTAAHDVGIVHRDLKPENVMVTAEGLVKVLDFGIAKRGRSEAATSHGPSTEQGDTRDPATVFGSAGYMSPEQAAGRHADARSDQFSFGAMLYEMLCGRRAFDRPTRRETLEAIAMSEPELLKGALSRPLHAVVTRCLAKAPERRFPSTREVARELHRIRDEHRDAARGMSRRRALGVGAGALAAAAAAGLVTWRALAARSRVTSLAVLPFVNGDDDPEIEYVCDGLTENVTRRMAFIQTLTVRPLSAAFNFKRGNVDAEDSGRRLGVDAVLTGSVSMREGRLRVDAQLVDVATGVKLWAEAYDRPAADLLGVQAELGRAIVTEGMRHPLSAADRRRFDRPATESAEANDLYLRALYFHRMGGETNYRVARELLARAVAKDATFALAHVSLASTFSVMTIDGFERPTDSWPESNRSVRRALEVDPDLPEAHAEQSSFWFFFDRDWPAAESEWKRALGSSGTPTLPDLLAASALKLWALDRVDEAIVFSGRARALDPLTARFTTQVADLLLHAGRSEEAVQLYKDVISRSEWDLSAGAGLAEAYRASGRYDEAIAVKRRMYTAPGVTVPDVLRESVERARGESGYRAIERTAVEIEADELRARARAGAYVSPLDLARAYAQLNDGDQAFRYLDAAFDERSAGLVFLRVDRAWRALRGDPRFERAVARSGLV